MSDSFYPQSVFEYKIILENMNNIEQNSRDYIKDVISDGYKSIEVVIAQNANEIMENINKSPELNKLLTQYIKTQNELATDCIKLINAYKCENKILFQSFDEIKRNLLEKKNIYKSINTTNKTDKNSISDVLNFLSNSIRYYEIKYSAKEKFYLDECLSILKDGEPVQLIRILHTIKTDIFTNDFENFYNIYKTVLGDLKKINDQNKIKDLNGFIENDRQFLSEMVDILSSFELSSLSISDSDMISLKIISKSIVEMYNKSNESYKKIKGENKNIDTDIKILSEEGFKRIIDKNSLSIITEEEAFLNFTKFATKITDNLAKMKASIFDYLLKHSEKSNLKDIIIQIDFAEDLAKLFKAIIIYIDDLISNNNDIDKKSLGIINGIYQSINIKIKNIEDYINSFYEESFKKGIDIDEDIYSSIKSEIFLLCEDNQLDKIERLNEILNTKYDKSIFVQSKNVDFEAEIFIIKKDCILHEVSTFEEIMNHSVLMLRSFDNKDVENYTNFMDSVNDDINALLEKNNITKIYPAISNKFNSMEHVVLVAEKNENFNKGEIIKIISSGFKENDKVLMKANVVCAK